MEIVRALRYRNYRLFFCGQMISLVGTWMQQVALSWLVYRLTQSPALLGVVGFVGQLPAFALSPFGGVLADRWSRHRILIVTQSLAMLQAIVLAFLVLTGTISIGKILVLSLFIGLVNSFDLPARQSFVVEMIENREDLSNAIALNSSMFNVARLLGPSIAGVAIAMVGEGVCFLANGISYIAVIVALLAMKVHPRTHAVKRAPVFAELREGFSYAVGSPPIKGLLLMVAIVSFAGMPYATLMPIFARDLLHGGPSTLGLLMASSGLGALTSAIYLASRKSVLGLGRIIPWPGAFLAAALSRSRTRACYGSRACC